MTVGAGARNGLRRRRGRTAILRRLRASAVLEVVNIALLPLLLYGLVGLPLTAVNVAGTVPALVLLAEGAAYWWLKAQQVADGAGAPRHLPVFHRLRTANVVLLAVAALPVAIGWVWRPGPGSAPGLGFWLLALAEHVNYFRVQLMHDTAADVARLVRRRRPGRSALARDLDRWQASKRP